MRCSAEVSFSSVSAHENGRKKESDPILTNLQNPDKINLKTFSKIDYPYGQFVPEVDDIQSKIDNINEVYTNYTKQISYGKYQGTAEEIVAEMQSALKQAGIEEVTAALQEQFDALYK